jgi:hypothetical protein
VPPPGGAALLFVLIPYGDVRKICKVRRKQAKPSKRKNFFLSFLLKEADEKKFFRGSGFFKNMKQ